MKKSEVLKLVKLAASIWQNQADQAETAGAWWLILEDANFESCAQAIKNLAKTGTAYAPTAGQVLLESRKLSPQARADFAKRVTRPINDQFDELSLTFPDGTTRKYIQISDKVFHEHICAQRANGLVPHLAPIPGNDRAMSLEWLRLSEAVESGIGSVRGRLITVYERAPLS